MWRCYQYGEQFTTVYYACEFLPTATTATGTFIAAATATTTDSATATTVLNNRRS